MNLLIFVNMAVGEAARSSNRSSAASNNLAVEVCPGSD